MSFSGATEGLVSTVISQDLPSFTVIALMMLLLMFLGVFMDQVSMMLISLPIFMPLSNVTRHRSNLVWCAIPDLHAAGPPASAYRPFLLMTMRGVALPNRAHL